MVNYNFILLSDIVTENATFNVSTFIPVLRERMYSKDRWAHSDNPNYLVIFIIGLILQFALDSSSSLFFISLFQTMSLEETKLFISFVGIVRYCAVTKLMFLDAVCLFELFCWKLLKGLSCYCSLEQLNSYRYLFQICPAVFGRLDWGLGLRSRFRGKSFI